jgi:hypothetical protein
LLPIMVASENSDLEESKKCLMTYIEAKETYPQHCQSRRFTGTGNVATFPNNKILPRKKAFCFFLGLLRPRKTRTPQEHLQFTPSCAGPTGARGWLVAGGGIQGGGRSGWTVQASAVGGSCRDRWRSLLAEVRCSTAARDP